VEVSRGGGINELGCDLLNKIYGSQTLQSVVDAISTGRGSQIKIAKATYVVDRDEKIEVGAALDAYQVLYVVSADGKTLLVDDLWFGGQCVVKTRDGASAAQLQQTPHTSFAGAANPVGGPDSERASNLIGDATDRSLLAQYVDAVLGVGPRVLLPAGSKGSENEKTPRFDARDGPGVVGAQFLVAVGPARAVKALSLLERERWLELASQHGISEAALESRIQSLVERVSAAVLGRRVTLDVDGLGLWRFLDPKTQREADWTDVAAIKRGWIRQLSLE